MIRRQELKPTTLKTSLMMHRKQHWRDAAAIEATGAAFGDEKGEATPSHGGVPLALEEGSQCPELTARLTNSTQIQSSPASTHNAPNTNMEEAAEVDPNKVHVTISAELLADLRSQCDIKASVSLLGRIQGKHPWLQALTTWARENLHPSLVLLLLQENNIFEVTFETPGGRIHALNQADLLCETAAIFFSSWRPHFDARAPRDTEKLDHPVWMQVANMCQVLRGDTFLHTIGENIGQVISIDNSEAYKAKLFGPRIRLLVKDIDNLPHTVVLPKLDGEGKIEYALEFSGLPNQCGSVELETTRFAIVRKKVVQPPKTTTKL